MGNANDEKIKFNHIAKCIEYDDEICTVKCENGTGFKCKYVMCCIPPSLYKTIQFEPSLSWERSDIANSFKMGYVIKTNVFYKTAFWRENNLSGFTVSCGDDENDEFPIGATDDDVKPDRAFPAIT